MNKFSWILALVGMCLSAHSDGVSIEEARRVFGALPAEVFSSSIVTGGYLFLEVKWQDDESLELEDREMQEMSAIVDAIEKFIVPPHVVCTNSPFCTTLTEWLLPETEYKIPQVESCVVKDEKNGAERCKVIAFEAEPMLDARIAARRGAQDPNNWSEKDWLERLKAVKQKFRTEDEKRKFCCLLGCPVVNLVLNRANSSSCSDVAGPESSREEFERILEWSPNNDSFFATHTDLLWSRMKTSDGMFYPYWQEDDAGRFAEAEKLYRRGRDIPRIMKLLSESIAINPVMSAKWEYLGGVLKASNMPDDAIIAYIQALRLNSSRQWAWKGLADSCEKAGMVYNAAGLRWYLKLEN